MSSYDQFTGKRFRLSLKEEVSCAASESTRVILEHTHESNNIIQKTFVHSSAGASNVCVRIEDHPCIVVVEVSVSLSSDA